MNNSATRKDSRSHYAQVRRRVIGVRDSIHRQEERLAEKFGESYKAWCKRRGIPDWDSSPNMRRNAK